MFFLMKCKNCGETIKFEEGREKYKNINCKNCGSVLEHYEEELLNNFVERASTFRNFELTSVYTERTHNQETIDNDLSKLYAIYCEETDIEIKNKIFSIIDRLYLICNRKKAKDIEKVSKAINKIFEEKEDIDIF